MSALGQKQTSRHLQPMSALPPKADITERGWYVRYVPRADIGTLFDHLVSASRKAWVGFPIRPFLPGKGLRLARPLKLTGLARCWFRAEEDFGRRGAILNPHRLLNMPWRLRVTYVLWLAALRATKTVSGSQQQRTALILKRHS